MNSYCSNYCTNFLASYISDIKKYRDSDNYSQIGFLINYFSGEGLILTYEEVDFRMRVIFFYFVVGILVAFLSPVEAEGTALKPSSQVSIEISQKR